MKIKLGVFIPFDLCYLLGSCIYEKLKQFPFCIHFRSKAVDYNISHFYANYCSIAFDAKAKSAVVCQIGVYLQEKFFCKRAPELLKQVFMTIPNAMWLHKNSYMLEALEETLQLIIPMGIPQYWMKYQQWMFTERYQFDNENESEPQILTLPDLSFGFIIWLISCSIAIFGFFSELIAFFIRKRMNPAKVVPILNVPKENRNLNVQPQNNLRIDDPVRPVIQNEFANETNVRVKDERLKLRSTLKSTQKTCSVSNVRGKHTKDLPVVAAQAHQNSTPVGFINPVSSTESRSSNVQPENSQTNDQIF